MLDVVFDRTFSAKRLSSSCSLLKKVFSPADLTRGCNIFYNVLRIFLSQVEQSLKKLDDNKSSSISEQTEDTSLKNAHETRAHSVPDFQTVFEKDDGEQDICHEELNASSTSPIHLSTENTRVSDSVHKTTTASSATKARTKSYATTQDGSRLSYCEVATGIDIASSRDDEVFQVRIY